MHIFIRLENIFYDFDFQCHILFCSWSLKFVSKEKKVSFSIADKQIIRSKLGLKLDHILLQEAVYLKNGKLIVGEKKGSL